LGKANDTDESSRTPFARLRAGPARHREELRPVRARPRDSSAALSRGFGRRGRKMRPTDVCTPNNRLRVLRASCVPSDVSLARGFRRRDQCRLRRLSPPFSRLRGVFRTPPLRSNCSEEEQAGTEELGTLRCVNEAGGPRVHGARAPLRRDRHGFTWGVVFPARASAIVASGTPVASFVTARGVFPPTRGPEGRRDRVRAAPRDGRCASSIRGAFPRQTPRARCARAGARTPRLVASSIARRSRDEDRRASTSRLPFPVNGSPLRSRARLPMTARPPFTRIRRERPSFRPERCRCRASLGPKALYRLLQHERCTGHEQRGVRLSSARGMTFLPTLASPTSRGRRTGGAGPARETSRTRSLPEGSAARGTAGIERRLAANDGLESPPHSRPRTSVSRTRPNERGGTSPSNHVRLRLSVLRSPAKGARIPAKTEVRSFVARWCETRGSLPVLARVGLPSTRRSASEEDGAFATRSACAFGTNRMPPGVTCQAARRWLDFAARNGSTRSPPPFRVGWSQRPRRLLQPTQPAAPMCRELRGTFSASPQRQIHVKNAGNSDYFLHRLPLGLPRRVSTVFPTIPPDFVHRGSGSGDPFSFECRE
jgi:hypothetical protein